MSRPPSFPPSAAAEGKDSAASHLGNNDSAQALPPMFKPQNHPSVPQVATYPSPREASPEAQPEESLPPIYAPGQVPSELAPTRVGTIPSLLPAPSSAAYPDYPDDSGYPGYPGAYPPDFPPGEPPSPAGKPRQGDKTRVRHPWRRFFLVLVALVMVAALVVVFWGLFLVQRVESRIGRVDALSGVAATPGTTWLIAGSDSREGLINDGTEGERSDSILLVHEAPNGKAAMVSLPRDTYSEIPGKGAAKLNAAFSWGGAPLLVQTVEGLTGLTVDHYVQVGMSGVSRIVDAVGGVNVCWDQSFHDRLTALDWQAGCHDVDGNTALLFSRMRYSDPSGDIGRTKRQRLVISAVLKKAVSREVIVSPSRQLALADAGAAALSIDREMKTWDVARLVVAMRRAAGDGMQGVPPIASVGYNPGHGVGSTVLLDREKTPDFFGRLAIGTLSPADLQPQQ